MHQLRWMFLIAAAPLCAHTRSDAKSAPVSSSSAALSRSRSRSLRGSNHNSNHLPYSTWKTTPELELPMPDHFEPDTADVREAWSPTIKICGGPGNRKSGGMGSSNTEIVRVFSWSGTKSSFLRTCGLFSGSQTREYHIYNYGMNKFNDMASTRQWMKMAEWDAAIKPFFDEPKIIVFNSRHIPASLLQAWPPKSLLLIANDESNRFGFSHPVIKAKDGNVIGPHVRKRTFYGPHDANMKRPNGKDWTASGVNLTGHLDGLFVKNQESRFGICETEPEKCPGVVNLVTKLNIPLQVVPIFKQYYSRRHAQSFPGTFNWFPLGPRFEFQRPTSFPGPQILRDYLFNFIGSPTSLARQRLAAAWNTIAATVQSNYNIPESRVKFHVAQKWAADTSEGNLAPVDYAAILRDSTFTLCPQGNNVDQFRIYEAIESGSIPVVALEHGLANKTLAPSTMASPIVFVNRWEPETFKQLAEMERDAFAISFRRKALQEWYQTLLDETLASLESALSQK